VAATAVLAQVCHPQEAMEPNPADSKKDVFRLATLVSHF
jgi:hypothetical protein